MVATAEQRCVMEEGGCDTFKEAYDLLANAVLVERTPGGGAVLVERIGTPITPTPLCGTARPILV
eukprot:3550898-Pyramimonas_sp.AAC.1